MPFIPHAPWRRRLLAGLCVLSLGVCLHTMWGGTGQQTTPIADGARHITLTVPEGPQATLSVVCFSTDRYKIEVVDNPKPDKHHYLADVAPANKAIAGCNGGYFNISDFTPFGLGIVNGVSSGKLTLTGAGGSLFGIRTGVAFICSEQEFQPSPEITALVQCGPRLVIDGRPFIVKGSPANARTFVMTDGRGQWAIGTATHLTLGELASVLARPGLIEGFIVRNAMNLDGGPSSGLWWQDKAGQPHEQRELWSVRNMLLVVPK